MRRLLLILMVSGPLLFGVPSSIWATEAGPAAWPEGEVLMTSRTITFAGGSSRVPGDAGPTLDAVAAWLIAHDAQVVVEGHTSVGFSEAESTRVSQRRAELVRDALIARGCRADRVSAVGLGTKRLVVARGAADEFRNRRVEFRLVMPAPEVPQAPTILLLDDEVPMLARGGVGTPAAVQVPLLDDEVAIEASAPRIPLLDAFAPPPSDDLIAPVFAAAVIPTIRIPLLDSDGPRLELLE